MPRFKKGILVFMVITTVFFINAYVHWTDSQDISHGKLTHLMKRTKATRAGIAEKNEMDKYLQKTVPPFYPLNGTGTTVNITGMFNNSIVDSFCANDPYMQAIVPIYSACENLDRRMAIRHTLGQSCIKYHCKIFFIVGVSNNGMVNDLVKIEMEKERDILVIDKIDTYRDLNNKAVAMLDWLTAYCTEPKYVIHCIDDAYVDFEYFLDRLKIIKYDNYIYGFHRSGFRPSRVRGSKIFISRDEYPFEILPNYIAGPAYAFLNSNTNTMRKNIHRADYCWVEDYWLTGHVALKSETKLISSKQNPLQGRRLRGSGVLKNFFYVHPVAVNGFYEIFNRTLANETLSMI